MIDYRSDTVTRPSTAMRKAMAEAEVGDDVLREDPTILRLEALAAEITGKEAALFVPSGTFANQLALFTWAPRGGEVYLNENAHIVQHEAGASAHISGAFLRPFKPASTPWAEWDDIALRIRPVRDQHFPEPALICLENALSDGTVQPLESMRAVQEGARKSGLPVHLDGARIFNAAAALGVEASKIAGYTDSTGFCLSKGLGAPVGSLLCGPADFIENAFYKRKIMGGGMRQAGILAAAGLVALKEELPRLGEDHLKAARLADAFSALPVFDVINPKPQINMVFLKLKERSPEKDGLFLSALKAEGILTYPPEGGVFRFVTHRDVNDEQVSFTVRRLSDIAGLLEKMPKGKAP
jgi:threonine aldolase